MISKLEIYERNSVIVNFESGYMSTQRIKYNMLTIVEKRL